MHNTSLTVINRHSSANQTYTPAKRNGHMQAVHSAYSDDPSNQSFLQYTLFRDKPETESKRWLANVSCSKQIKHAHLKAINVQPTANKDDFSIIKSLLLAKTCHTIMFDKSFNVFQTKALKELARLSGTKLAFINNKTDYQDCFEQALHH